MKKEYYIEIKEEIQEEIQEIEAIKLLAIDQYPWSKAYKPEATAKLCYIKNKGFNVQMTCYEQEPLARFKKPNEPVYKDSCLEFFINFYPEDAQAGYVNFEINSLGTMLCQYGKAGGKERIFLLDKGLTPPKVKTRVTQRCWQVEFFIEIELIKSLYGKNNFKKGHILEGNFYKCGDETAIPHYGTWSPINYDFPSFHRPEQFGKFVLG